MYSGDVGYTYASKNYAIQKQQMNPAAGGYVDFYLSGNLFKSFYLNVQNTEFSIMSNVDYYGKLVSKFPEMVVYTKEYIEKEIKPFIIQNFIHYLL